MGNSKLIKYTLVIEHNNTKVNLKIVSKKVLKKKTLNRIIRNIFLMISIKKLKTPTVEDINIILIMTLFKKKIPSIYKILGPREVNSGVCIFNTRKILIFRKEENEKLLIHELCHLLEMNHSKNFWKAVALICPNYDYQRDWLTQNGRNLHKFIF